MKTLAFVWGFIAFSILGSEFFNKTETFDALQDFESNFNIVGHPEEFLPNWSANEVRPTSSRVFQAHGEGVNLSKALGIQPISSFNAQIYIKTTSIGLESPRISLQAKTKRNGSGNRPVYVFYSFSVDEGKTFTEIQALGNHDSFPNEDSPYQEYEFFVPDTLLEHQSLLVKLEVHYGDGQGSAARLFMDDFTMHGLVQPATFPLEIDSVGIHDEKTLLVRFNQPIQLTPENGKNSFFLNQGYGPPEITAIEGRHLYLEFSHYLYSNHYELTMNHLISEDGKEIGNNRKHGFEIFSPTPPRTIILNEFMADPNPKGLVPEDPVIPSSPSHEYIELYNATDKPIRLKGFTLSGGKLEDLTLAPDAYALVTAMDQKELFTPFGLVTGVSGFRNLANREGHISLRDSFENVVDSLSYTLDWYGDMGKSNGGWAMERINSYPDCYGQDYWRASISPQGGTPGKANSMFEDTLAFSINRILPISSREIKVLFSKAIHQEGVQTASFIWGGAILEVKEIYQKEIVLTTPEVMIQNSVYELYVENLSDCSGVELQPESFSYTFDRESPKILRVAGISPEEINVYFNKPPNRNSSETEKNYLLDKAPDLVQSAQLMDSMRVLLKLEKPLQINQEYSLTIFNLEDEDGNVTEEETFPFLFDDHLDTVIISAPNIFDVHFHTEVDSLSSSLTHHYSVDGNLGHPQSAFRNSGNLKLVHLIFDKDLPQNISGNLDVQHIQDVNGKHINTLRKSFVWDQRPLSASRVEVENDSTLSVYFNKPLLPTLAELPFNYLVNQEIGHPFSVILMDSLTVILQFKNKFVEGEIYRLSISGLRDIFGVSIQNTFQINFDYDLSLPEIAAARLVNPFSILLKSNRAIILPTDSGITISQHELMDISAFDETGFLLTTRQPITQDRIEIRLIGLTDLKGNTADTILVHLPNDKVYLGGTAILQENIIQLTFSAELDPVTSFLPEHYAVDHTQPREVAQGENNYELLLHLKASLSLKDSVEVEVKTVKSRGGKENHGVFQKLWYDDGIEDLYVLNPQLIQIIHAAGVDKAATEEAVFILKEQEIAIKPLVNQTDPRIVQLVLDQALTPDFAYELSVPPRYSSQGEMFPGSARRVIWDQTPPKLLLAEALNERELLISFDEPLDPILSLIPSFYQVGETEPTEVIPGEMAHQVILVFKEIFQKDTTYVLQVVQLEDMHRNAIIEERLTFVFDGPVSPKYKEIIINEVMAAPRGGNSLPDAEYIELFNAGENEVFLGGLFLTNSRSGTVLPRETLEPGTYLILTANHHQAAMEAYGRTIGLNHWPTLLNEGDDLTLLDPHGRVLDQLSYQTSHYGTSEKAQGGFSLEVVNPFSICPEAANLTPSHASDRGTPGTINSVFDDTPDPSQTILLKASPKGLDFVALDFSKRLNDHLDGIEILAVPHLEIQALALDGENPRRLMIELKEPLEENQLYEITIHHIRDCEGSLIDTEKNTAVFAIPVPATDGDILLNEVLFNPRTGGAKFVEIYNRSGKFVSLTDWKLANASSGNISNPQTIPSPDLIIHPLGFMVFTTDADILKSEYPNAKSETFVELPSLPSYPVSRGTVIFSNPGEDLMERFDYDEKFHHQLLNDVKGISLERYSLDHEVNDPKNWHSASSPEGFATPGYRNSQTIQEGVLEKGISITPQVFVPDSPGEQNFTTINYKLDQPGLVGTLRIYSVGGQLIKEICQNEPWGSSGFYTWDGTDLSGRLVRTGYYIVWVEVLNLDGRVENIKKTVVVGSRF